MRLGGPFGFISFSAQRRSDVYLFFYLLLQASLFSDNCAGEWVLRLTV